MMVVRIHKAGTMVVHIRQMHSQYFECCHFLVGLPLMHSFVEARTRRRLVRKNCLQMVRLKR